MFELFADATPNARKISIMLEEIKKPFKVTYINLEKGDQFNDHFKKISPFSKIPILKNTITRLSRVMQHLSEANESAQWISH